MSRVNRQWNYKDFVRLLNYNNYVLVRHNKHVIYSNGKKKITINKSKLNQMIVRRLIKEHELTVRW